VTQPVDLYDSHYEQAEADVYRTVRTEAFGEDLGQTSWITATECDEFARWLDLRPGLGVLEIACGTGGVALRLAQRHAVSVVGMDVNGSAVLAATQRAKHSGAGDRVRFQQGDADAALPFASDSFDAVFCNDAINHFSDRRRCLAEWNRVLRPGGRCLYTDPIVVTGPLSNAEMTARSSIGFFVFSPLGSNERSLAEAGFRLRTVTDVTEGGSDQLTALARGSREGTSPTLRARGRAKVRGAPGVPRDRSRPRERAAALALRVPRREALDPQARKPIYGA
jgi:SAM-dependent methyltransferase